MSMFNSKTQKKFFGFILEIMIVLGSRKGLDKTLKTLPAELIDKINFYNLSGRQILKRLAEETYISIHQVLHLSPGFRLLFPEMQLFSIPLSEFKYPDFDESAMPDLTTEYPPYYLYRSERRQSHWRVYDPNVEVKLGEYDGLVEGNPEKMLLSRFASNKDSVAQMWNVENEDLNIWPEEDHENIKHIAVAPDHKKIYIHFKDVGPYRRQPVLHIEVKPIQVNNRGGFVRGEIVAHMEEKYWPFGLFKELNWPGGLLTRKRAREE